MSKIKYQSKVIITKGFYKGYTGVAIRETLECIIIKLDFDSTEVRFLSSEMELVDDK